MTITETSKSNRLLFKNEQIQVVLIFLKVYFRRNKIKRFCQALFLNFLETGSSLKKTAFNLSLFLIIQSSYRFIKAGLCSVKPFEMFQ